MAARSRSAATGTAIALGRGTFGTTDIKVPRARLTGPGRKTTEWKIKVLRTYQRPNGSFAQ
jgi:hypothetical protein